MAGYECMRSKSSGLKLSKPNRSAVDGEVNPAASAKLGRTQVRPESSYIEDVRAPFHCILRFFTDEAPISKEEPPLSHLPEALKVDSTAAYL